MRIPLLTLVCLTFFAQAQDTEIAPWVAYPSADNQSYGVYHFRKVIKLETIPNEMVVHISADNRYIFFVNGQRVCYGPAKGDLKTYKYDVIDLAPFLKVGDNLLAATVYNAGAERPDSQISAQTAFMVRAAEVLFSQDINTDESWKVLKNPAYEPVTYHEMLFENRWFYGYYACGPGDRVDASNYPWGWQQLDFDDSEWQSAQVLIFQEGRGGFGRKLGPPWNLVPRTIPFMDSYVEQPKSIRRSPGVDNAAGVMGEGVAVVSPNTEATLLMDYELFTMGYPELSVRGGAGSEIKVRYAEALYEEVNLKGHRDSVNNLTMEGVWDVFETDGGERTFRPLWKRAFRYVQLDIATGDAPLEIVSFQSEYSGYPYREMASFDSDDPRLNEIFTMSQQTLRMCSGETYYDTPYYEQLSYGGDNRPIGNISVYNSLDDRLFREVMRIYPQSQNPETGLMFSAYPSSRTHWDMGSWAMAWVQSQKDYYMLRGDKEYALQFTNQMSRILEFYQEHIDEELGILGVIPNRNFIDWSITKGSLPRRNEERKMVNSILLTLYYAHTLDCAAQLFSELGRSGEATDFEKRAANIKAAVMNVAWDDEKQLFRDYPNQPIYSQHVNIFAILCDVVPEDEQGALLVRLLAFDEFDEYASSYFSFFLFKAMEKVGRPDLYIDNLDHWQNFIDRGHTTTGETGFASHDRSDCHAWSAHPAFYFLQLIAGIRSDAIGFKRVSINPSLGNLSRLQADMPHPLGRITVDYTRKKERIKGTVTLPPGLSGTFVFGEQRQELVPGVNKIR